MTDNPSSGPNEEEIKRVTNAIIEACGPVDLESALAAVCNLAGQLICALSEGQPKLLELHSASVHNHIHKTAVAKMLYDDEKAKEAKVENP